MQDSRKLAISSLFILTLLISACAPYHPTNPRAAVCNQLNSQIIFNGSTPNTRQQELQAAEAPMVQRTYDNDNCRA